VIELEILAAVWGNTTPNRDDSKVSPTKHRKQVPRLTSADVHQVRNSANAGELAVGGYSEQKRMKMDIVVIGAGPAV